MKGESVNKETDNAQAQGDDYRAHDVAAEAMIAEAYVFTPVNYRLPSQVVQDLRVLGYTDINDFDIDYGMYEVEATNRLGNEIELEIDPLTGVIVDVDDNWF